MNTPDVGDIVEYGLDSFGKKPQTWRVSSWLRIAPPRQATNSNRDWLDEILYDSCQKIKGHRMQYCTREEATHLGLSGISGAIAPISECKVVGNVGWTGELLESERKHAQKLGEKHEMVF